MLEKRTLPLKNHTPINSRDGNLSNGVADKAQIVFGHGF